MTTTKKSNIKKSGEYLQAIQGLRLDNHWFLQNASEWLRIFEKFKLNNFSRINCLEIGSFQGLSAHFLLYQLPNATITCVDTWAGSDEHQFDQSRSALPTLEESFDANLNKFSDRVVKKKGTSLQYFMQENAKESFDLIYVDGSHYGDDVLIDAIKGFEFLKTGGIMIFDDYFWTFYENIMDNPAPAINSFLRLKSKRVKIISFSHSQIAIQKV